MDEFAPKIDSLIKRLRRGIAQYDHTEERACAVEASLSKLNESVEVLARLIEISSLLLMSPDKEKIVWLQTMKDEDFELTNPNFEQFFHRLECYLRREMIDMNEKQAYIQALSLLQPPFTVSSGFFKE